MTESTKPALTTLLRISSGKTMLIMPGTRSSTLLPPTTEQLRSHLPYTLRYLAICMQYALTKDRYVPIHSPGKDWVQYGRDPRSAVSFKHNLGAILDLASRRGDRVLLMTFATYTPKDYSLEAFKAKRLDYGLHLNPL